MRDNVQFQLPYHSDDQKTNLAENDGFTKVKFKKKPKKMQKKSSFFK